MEAETWQAILVGGLIANAVIGLGYRVYRHTKGGPIGDVWGQAILGGLLLAVAAGVALGATWLRWAGFAYAVLFGVIVMPIWVLGVLLPMRPRAIDYSFTITYWALLIANGVAALLA